MSAATKSSCAFIGGTGGSANAALVLALQNGHQCSALARTPEKLTKMLLDAGVSQSTLDSQLTIVKGNAKEVVDMKTLFTTPNTPDLIISGIGSLPFGNDVDMTICQVASRNIVTALEELKPAKRPHIMMISTTGITDKARDVPLLWVPLYYVLLHSPHKDKRLMEKYVVDCAAKPDSPLSGFTFARPTLLLDREEPRGIDAIQAGLEDEPALGYFIGRKDVGLWIYEEIIKGDESKWRNTKVSLTT